MSNKTHIESTSADKIAIGFEYQYYYFLLRLLELKSGQSIGMEIKDDVHTDLDNDYQILYQIKHTIHEGKNLTTRDIDLWKTLSNWSKVITDKNDGRTDIKTQLEFVQKTDFILFSNKLDNDSNEVIKLINNLNYSIINVNDFFEGIKLIREKTKDETIISYIDNFLSLDFKIIEKFIYKVRFELGKNDIFPMLYDALRAKMVNENDLEQVLKNLDSSIRQDNFISIKNNQKIEISFNDFYQKYRVYFHPYGNRLPIRPFTDKLPSHNEMKEQTFIKQLLDLGDFDENDVEQLSILTKHKLTLFNNITLWHQNGEITHMKCDKFHEDAKNIWRNIWRKKNRSGLNNDKSLEIIDEIRGKNLTIDSQVFDTAMSNGEFYHLSDIPEIGWSIDWEKYKQ